MGGRLIVMVGISNSGKSSLSSAMISGDFNKYALVNRDKIREMMFGYTESNVYKHYEKDNLNKLEKMVTKEEDNLIHEGLSAGKIVIIDSTNLKREYIERYKYWNVPTELIFVPITLKEALVRDFARNRNVGDNVIIKQYNRYVSLMDTLEKDPIDFTIKTLTNDKELPKANVIDLDGTLCEMGSRTPFEWHKVGEDTLIEGIGDIVRSLAKYSHIIICTGRDSVCLGETEKWLHENDIPYNDIMMRPKNDYRPDWVVKEEMWRHITKEYYINSLFEDRLQVVRRGRSLGLKVLNVEYINR